MYSNEGRRRPSLIAATCFCACQACSFPTRGAGAPPSLRQVVQQPVLPPPVATRGAGAPPSLRQTAQNGPPPTGAATRGAGAPPSLRQHLRPLKPACYLQRGAPAPLPHCGRLTNIIVKPVYGNEGRRRPSLIAAFPRHLGADSEGTNEGRRRPSLIAAASPAPTKWINPTNEGRRRPSLIAAQSSSGHIGCC